MTLNLIRDDPLFMLENVIIPLKNRIFEEKKRVIGFKKQFYYNSFSFGTIKLKNGFDSINDLIEDL